MRQPLNSIYITRRMFRLQENALKAVCPATLDILLKALLIGTATTTAPPSDTRQRTDLVSLKDLVLKCLVNVVHCLHTCSPDQVGTTERHKDE